MDVVFPQKNEDVFIEMAKKLGFSSLCLVYPFKDAKQIEHIKNIKQKLDVLFGLLVTPPQITKAKKTADLVFVQSSPKDRWVIEKNHNVILFDVEHQVRKDFMHHRNSGLNQVLCKLANKNNNTIGIAFSHLKSDKMPILFGRISQNIRLCRKYKVNMMLASFAESLYDMRANYDLQSFATVLGMHPGEAKNAVRK